MKLSFFAPVLTFAVIAGVMFYALFFLDPTLIPSEFVDRKVPEFSALEPVPGYGPDLSSENLSDGKVVLFNVFASWCVACLIEHPVFMKLKAEGNVEIFGLNYKDTPEAAAKWLAKNGNPYTRTGMDPKGRLGIEFGVYGVPETFIIGPDGTILDKIIGAVTANDLKTRILPRIAGNKK